MPLIVLGFHLCTDLNVKWNSLTRTTSQPATDGQCCQCVLARLTPGDPLILYSHWIRGERPLFLVCGCGCCISTCQQPCRDNKVHVAPVWSGDALYTLLIWNQCLQSVRSSLEHVAPWLFMGIPFLFWCTWTLLCVCVCVFVCICVCMSLHMGAAVCVAVFVSVWMCARVRVNEPNRIPFYSCHLWLAWRPLEER